MPTCRIRGSLAVICCGWGLVSAATCLAGEQQPPAQDVTAPPEVEAYLSSGRAQQFLTEASAYVEAHPNSPAAARLTFETFMLARVGNHDELMDLSLERLLFAWPDSIMSRFALTALADPDRYRAFLVATAWKHQGGYSKGFARIWIAAVELGVATYGAGLLAEDDFLLMCALLASESEQELTRLAALDAASRVGIETEPITDIAFAAHLTVPQKIDELGALRHRPITRLYQQVLYSRLKPLQRHKRSVVRAMAAMYLEAGQMDQALEVLNASNVTDDPQLACWRAWCLATLGKTEQSRRAFDQAAREHAESPWATTAAVLAHVLEDVDNQFDAHSDAVYSALRTVESELQPFHGRVTLARPGTEPVEWFVSVDMAARQLEVHASRGEQTLLSYRADAEGCRVYAGGDDTIYEFTDQGVYPVLSASLVQRAAGRAELSFGFQFADHFADLAAGLQPLLGAPALQSRLSVKELLRGQLELGLLPLPVVRQGGIKSYAWVRMGIDEPQLERFEFSLDANSRPSGFQAGSLSCEHLSYAPIAGAQSPAWPELPVVSKPRIDGVTLLKLLNATAVAWQPREAAAAISSRPEHDRQKR